MKMLKKYMNPTGFTLKPRPRLNGKWWDGLNSGEEISTDDVNFQMALVKCGAVEVKPKPKPEPVKAVRKKPRHRKGGK